MRPCPTCGRQLAANAVSCPQCGHLLLAAAGPAGATVLVEKTSKELKKARVQWMVFLVVAILILVVGAGRHSVGATVVGGLATFVGCVGSLVNHARTWWRHG